MEENTLQKYVNLNFSTRKIAVLENTSQTNVRYWLNKLNLKTNSEQFALSEHKCKCGETNPDKFYGHSKKTCSKCHNLRTINVGKNNRIFAVEVLGGKCIECGYDKHTCSLDIHHLDPSIKDKTFRSMRGWCKERILNEIKNCVLLCSNCHAEVHAGHIVLS
jgi:Zn ribbon nucleic-acid-binding protein